MLEKNRKRLEDIAIAKEAEIAAALAEKAKEKRLAELKKAQEEA